MNRAASASLELQHEIEQFLYAEADLLQRGEYDTWLELFSDDVRYWMPARMTRRSRADSVSSETELAIFDDDKRFLRARVERLRSPLAHAEQPPSRVRYFISNVRIESESDSRLRVQCNVLIHQTRLERLEVQFVGERFDRMMRAADGWSISERKFVLDQTMIPRSISIFF